MCRYGMDHLYSQVFACLDCQVSFKGNSECPNCKQPMVAMGRDFKPPRKTNDTQWKKIRHLVEHGVLFHSCGCTGPGYRPRTFSEAKQTIRHETADERFRRDLVGT